MARRGQEKLGVLKARERVAMGSLERAIKAARQRVAIIVHSAARDRGLVISGRNRERLYKRIGDVYLQLDNGLKDWGKDLVNKSAIDWHDEAISDITGQTGVDPSNQVTRFSREYAEDVWKRVAPENGKSLAAVFTDKMSQEDVKALRRATVDVYREASLSGMTLNEIHAAIQDKWDKIAGDQAAFQFVDSAGRPWETARYLQMLVRTTTARVARDSYFETLTKHGDDLAVIANVDGEACDICQAWDGVIISITGSSDAFPSYAQATAAGWGHPNCRCSAERVDETLDAQEIQKQADTPTPDFEQQDGESAAAYRNRMTEEVAAYSEGFGTDSVMSGSVQSRPAAESYAEHVRAQIRQAVFTSKEDIGGGVNESFKLTNGEKVVFKPADGEYDTVLRDGVEPGTQYKREKAASILDEALGFNLVPPTDVITHEGQIGSAQLFKDGFVRADRVPGDWRREAYPKLPEEVREQWYAFDQIAHNTDRHSGNFMFKLHRGKAEVALIDNGLCFSSETPPVRIPYSLEDEFGGKAISQSVLDKVASVLHSKDVLVKKLEPLLEPRSIKLLIRRMEEMVATRTHL